MTDENTLEAEVNEIAAEGRQKFSLEDRLRNRPMRTDVVTIYTDEPLADKVGGARDRTDRGIVIGRERWGILGKIEGFEEIAKGYETILAADDATPDQKKEARAELKKVKASVKNLREEVAPLIEQMKKTSLVFHLRAIPPVIVKDARRKAKSDLDIKGKGIPEHLEEAFGEAYEARIIAAAVDRYVDTESGESIGDFGISDARSLSDLLPAGEFQRLSAAVADLQYRNTIDENATDNADF